MLNMNSPTVQNLMQSGFNPYNNSGYIPQQPVQQTYYGYNPYMVPQQNNNTDELANWQYSYDPMPQKIVNEARGINSQIVQPSYNNNGYYNNQVFNGYMNPFLMRNQIENDRIRQREEAIQQGRIWRSLLKTETMYDEDFDIDTAVQNIESLYYYEPYKQEMTMKERIVVDKNNHIAEIEAKMDYYRQNNIPVITPLDNMRAGIYGYFNAVDDIIGDINNCDMVDYFTRVYPDLKYKQLSSEAERFGKNLKNKYNSEDFNKLIDKVNGDKPDSYYYKLMESFSDNGVKLETSNGLVITPDEMEVKLPSRLIKNKQDEYYERRVKFFNSVFSKEG